MSFKKDIFAFVYDYFTNNIIVVYKDAKRQDEEWHISLSLLYSFGRSNNIKNKKLLNEVVEHGMVVTDGVEELPGGSDAEHAAVDEQVGQPAEHEAQQAHRDVRQRRVQG